MTMMNFLPLVWNFRPTALSRDNYEMMSRDEMMDWYMHDNTMAWRDGVRVPKCTSDIRLVQWNIYNWNQTVPGAKEGILHTILDTEADIYILNEYYWGYRGPIQKEFENILQRKGYTLYCATGHAPTAVATRSQHTFVDEIRLGHDRSAMVLRVKISSTEQAWVVGTHLEDYSTKHRREEIQVLLRQLDKLVKNNNERILLSGDFNQQREQDYNKEEWVQIIKNKKYRDCHINDFVSTELKNAGFYCIFDRIPNICNWNKKQKLQNKPPATHWTGTIIDYTYSRNMYCNGVFINPVYWSDHRMVVSDWTTWQNNDNSTTEDMSVD